MLISFRSGLMLLLLTILLVTALLVAGSAYWNAKFAVEFLGSQLLNQASLRITQDVTNTLEGAKTQGEENSNLISNGFLDPLDYRTMSQFFLGVIESQPLLSYLSFGLSSGEYWHVTRDKEGDLRVEWFIPNADGGFDLIELLPMLGGGFEEIARKKNSDRTPPYERPYYLAAQQAGKSVWPETYVFLGTSGEFDIPGITRATPVMDDQGEILGVLTADFDLISLCHYLKNIRLGERGYAFLMEYRLDGTRRLIAHPRAPDEIALTAPTAEGKGEEALEIKDSQDSCVRALEREMPAKWGLLPKGLSSVKFQSEGEEWLGAFRSLEGEDNPAWVVGMVIPEREVFGKIHEMNRTSLIIALIGVLLVIVLSLIVARRISRPLQFLAEETHEIAGFNLEKKPVVSSYVQEIQRLGTATEEMKAGLRSFRKYVPAELVKSLLASGKEAVLGGERRRITIFFSDIANFTSIAESLEPEVLSELLAEYLGMMTQEMVRTGATVDKYIGDAIMAFWGAPHDIHDQAWLACQTALANQSALVQLRGSWGDVGRPLFSARIGIHTGEAVVGNFGSENRLDYTAIGDSVNLASRLEGLNRLYGTNILLSQDTVSETRDRIVARKIDRVAVKGRSEGVTIYELIGLPEKGTNHTLKKIEDYEAALELYFNSKFSEAISGFQELVDGNRDDGPSSVMLERSQWYLENPPPESWGGIHIVESKY